jgi:hypothetical protein
MPLPSNERKLLDLNKTKCEHISRAALECNVGGFASFRCYEREFHMNCPYKKRHSNITKKEVNLSEVEWL